MWNDVPWEAGTAEDVGTAAAKDSEKNQLAVQVGTFPRGVFGTARDILGAEELLVSFYTEPELVHDIMDTFTFTYTDYGASAFIIINPQYKC